MIWHALFTYLHLVSAGLLAGLLVAQHWLLKRGVDRQQVALLGALGLGHLLAAIAVLATGLALASAFGRGAAYYASSPMFLLKMGLFLLLAVMSGWPLLQYVQWSREFRHGPRFAPLGREVERVRAVLSLMMGVAALLPLPAILVSRGVAG